MSTSCIFCQFFVARSFSVIFSFFGVFRLALSLRLNDETEHLALRRTNQFLVFDSVHCVRTVRQRGSDDHVEYAKSVS